MKNGFRALLACLFLLAAALSVSAQDNSTGFDDISLTVTITVNRNGTAHVKEDSEMVVSDSYIQLYQDSLASTPATIEAWREITGSKNLRYHVLGAPLNTRVFPQPLDRLQFVNKSIAVITVEYDASTPIFTIEETGPRTFR
ncbi:Uncharacterised protein [uncultured archaeon]|nr:Uncharacterised protein [uncultured archaeon]